MSPIIRKPKVKFDIDDDDPVEVALEPAVVPEAKVIEDAPVSPLSAALQAARNALEGGDISACHSAIMVALQEVRKLQ